MKKSETEIFTAEIKLPPIVQKKAQNALSSITTEETDMKKETKKNNSSQKHFLFRRPAAAVIAACLLIVGGITATAAACRYFGSGMRGVIQATPTQQQTLLENGMATVLEAAPEETLPAVTSGDVTVKAAGVIADSAFVHLSFSVEGYLLEEGTEPCFEYIHVYRGTDPQSEDGYLNMSGSFFDGIVRGGDGKPVYLDGSPIAFDENGRLLEYYMDENGALEFDMVLWAPEMGESLLGETIHVEFENLGTVYKAQYENVLTGKWAFDIPISGNSAATEYTLDEALGDSGITVKTAVLSPISIQLTYGLTAKILEAEESGDNSVLPSFTGVRLKDGTLLPYLGSAGTQYMDAASQEYRTLTAFEQVIDVDQVEALLFYRPGQDSEDGHWYFVPLEG